MDEIQDLNDRVDQLNKELTKAQIKIAIQEEVIDDLRTHVKVSETIRSDLLTHLMENIDWVKTRNSALHGQSLNSVKENEFLKSKLAKAETAVIETRKELTAAPKELREQKGNTSDSVEIPRPSF